MSPERNKVILFFRKDGFYPTGYPKDYSDWAAEAARNPGTIRIEDIHGRVLWPLTVVERAN